MHSPKDKKINEDLLSQSGSWLIIRMRALGFKADLNGVCLGISHMAKQAILTRERAFFDLRLKKIFEIPLDHFAKTFESLKIRLIWMAELKALYETKKLFGFVMEPIKFNWTQINHDEIKKQAAREQLDRKPLIIPH